MAPDGTASISVTAHMTGWGSPSPLHEAPIWPKDGWWNGPAVGDGVVESVFETLVELVS